MATAAPTYERTGTGYKRAGETEEVRCIRFYLTEDERRAFLRLRAEAGHTENTPFIVEALGLGQSEEEAFTRAPLPTGSEAKR